LEGHLKNIAVTEERLQRLQELQEFRTSQGFETSCQSFGSEKLLQERMPRRHTRLRVPRKRVSARILFLIFVSCKFSKKYEQVNAYYSLKTLQLNIFFGICLRFKFLKLLNFIFKI